MPDDRELLALIEAVERGHAEPETADTAEAPMPIPSTWLEAPCEEPSPWGSRQLVAAGFGLGLGLLLIVPVLIWSLPRSVLPGAVPEITRRLSAGGPPQPLVAVASVDTEWHGRLAAGPLPPQIAPAAEAGEDAETALLLARGELLASSGDLEGARGLLLNSGDPERPAILFALAETFDPNMLAAWGLRDARADPSQARGFYERALAHGVPRARARLDALK